MQGKPRDVEYFNGRFRRKFSRFFNKNKLTRFLRKEGEDPILNHPKILELEEFLRSNANYLENFSKMSLISQSEVFSTVNMLFAEFKNNVNLIGRLTKLIKSCQNLSTSLVLEEALELMVRETCENLSCDRVISQYFSIFLNNFSIISQYFAIKG